MFVLPHGTDLEKLVSVRCLLGLAFPSTVLASHRAAWLGQSESSACCPAALGQPVARLEEKVTGSVVWVSVFQSNYTGIAKRPSRSRVHPALDLKFLPGVWVLRAALGGG